MPTYDVGGVSSHGDDGPVHGPKQLLHDDLHMPLGGALHIGEQHMSTKVTPGTLKFTAQRGCKKTGFFFGGSPTGSAWTRAFLTTSFL